VCQCISWISFERSYKLLKREILRLADSLRMTMLIARSDTSARKGAGGLDGTVDERFPHKK
jgi:hypothetical protein